MDEKTLGRVIHLEELAAYSGYSLWHIFKEVTGVSLGKYIRQRRLAGAVNLLRNSNRVYFRYRTGFWFWVTVPLYLYVS